MKEEPKLIEEIDIKTKTFDCQQFQIIEIKDKDGKRWKAVTVFIPIEESGAKEGGKAF